MPLSLHSKTSRKTLFFFAGNTLRYEDAIVEGVRAKTGLDIDPYGNTVLYKNHIESIIGLIASDKAMNRDLAALKQALQTALLEGDSVVLVGD